MTGKIVMAAYRPKPGRAADLEALLAEHVPTLRREDLATARPVVLLRSTADGAYIEIFEWMSGAPVDAAHDNPRVMALWQRIGEAADILRLADLVEAGQRFPQFEPIEGVVL